MFEALHRELIETIEPRKVVEEGLVQQIAVALWRLQRGTQVEAAATGLAADRIEPAKRAEAQEWIERINAAWRIEMAPLAPLPINAGDAASLRVSGLGPVSAVRDMGPSRSGWSGDR